MGNEAGFYNGKHYSDYVEIIKIHKKEKNYSELIPLLNSLIEATEKESKSEGWGVAPAYYEELANVYKKLKDKDMEIKVLKRFARQKHAPGVKPPKLMERLKKLQTE